MTGMTSWKRAWHAFGARSARRQARRLHLDILEDRTLPSGFAPTLIRYAPAGFATADGSATPLASSFTPAQINQAYGVNAISFNGIVGNGAGQTIAIIDAYDNPDLVSSSAANFASSDLHTFDMEYGLPEPSGFFTKVNEHGGTSYPGVDPAGDWEAEEALDVEWAHAVAPQANIILVEANGANNSLYTAIHWAAKQNAVSVISMSWGGGESSGETWDDNRFTTPSGHQGITFIASTGDDGAPSEYPAYSPNVVAVGGTSLTLNADSSYNGETGWNDSGGGISVDEAEPSYQLSVQSSGMREVPDVAFDADPYTGVAVCDSYNYGASTPWWQFGGTSLGAPSWAGLIAIADQGRVVNGFGTLNGASQTLPKLYGLPAGNFHDITTGNNGFAAGPGYDLVTGRGTPIANMLVPALAGDSSTALITSNNSVVVGQPFTLTATVTGAAPTGTVTFMNGTTSLGTASLNASDQATLVVSNLDAGSYSLGADYGGDANNGPSDSSALSETVGPASTSVVLASSLNPAFVGQAVTFTATVSVTAPGAGTPGGTVTFDDGATPLGTGTLNAAGVATFTTSTLALGNRAITAHYGGSGDFGGGTSPVVAESVLAVWNEFNGNAQHTGISTVPAQPMDQILWQTSVNLQGSYFWHTGEPVFTIGDTVIVPVKVTSGGNSPGTTNFELEAFNGNTGALMWTAASQYVTPSYTWLPPYQPVYDPVTNRVYFPGPGGTLYYISNPDNPGSATPTPVQVAFYGTANYTANASAYNATIFIDTPLTVDTSGNVFFGFTQTGSNPSGINDGGIGRVSATGAGTYVTTGVAVGAGSGSPAIGSAPAVSNDGSILYVAINDSNGPYLVGVNATTLAHLYAVALSVPNSNTGVELINQSTAAPMVAPDGTVFQGVFADNYDGSRGFMTHYSANLATEYTPGAFGWDDTASIIPTSMVPSYTGASSYLILTKYNNYVAAETGSSGGNGVNEIAVLDPYATQTDPNNDPNPNMLVMKQILTVTSPTEDSDYINGGYPDATREWCTNGTAVDPASDSVFINNEDGYSYRWNLDTNTITQAVEITDGYGEPYTPTAIGPNGVVYALNGGTLFALGGYSNYTLTNVSSLTPSVVGQSVTFTTTLASSNGGAVPTGSITYSYTSGANDPANSTPITLGTVTLVNGQASFTTSALVPDHYHIIATYSGDTTDGYAAGSTTLVQVILANPTTTVASSAPTITVGQSVTFTATVNPNGIFFVPLGTVSFLDGNTVLGTVALNALDQSTSPASSQVATFTTSSLTAGSHAIKAVYSGDLNFAGSTSNTLTQVVLIATTTTLVDNGPNPSVSGQNVSFGVTVSPSVPNGETVTLEDASNGNAVVGSGTLTGGMVTINVSNLTVGSHNIFAVYGGDSTYAGSQSSQMTQTVTTTTVSLSLVNINSDAANTALYDGGVQRSMVDSVVYHFNTAVNLDASAVTITLHPGVTVTLGNGSQSSGTVGTVPDATTWASPDGGFTWVVTFGGAGVTGGGSIADGVYDITLNAAHITTTSGGAVTLNNFQGGTGSETDTFWCLFGDANQDQKVTAQDYGAFAASYLARSSDAAYLGWFDQQGDDKVTAQDYGAFANNYLKKYSGFTATL